MATNEDHHDAQSRPATKIAEPVTRQLALKKAYLLIDRYVAEVAADARANPFTREAKDLKQPNDQ